MNSLLRLCVQLSLLVIAAAQVAVATEPKKVQGFQFKPVTEQSLGLWENGEPVLVYNHGMVAKPEGTGGRPRSCYIHPVYGLDGEILTDDFPKDHTYHRGMFWAWSHIRIGETEYDLWSNKGELVQVFGRWLARDLTAKNARIGVENAWSVGDKALVREEVWLDVQPATSDSRAIDVTLRWTSLEQPLTLSGAEGKSYGGFNFRFGPRGRTIISVPEETPLPEGVSAPAGRTSGDLLVTKLPWADLSGNFRANKDAAEKELSGAAVFVHPQHRDFPPTWMTRHYGLISVGWPGVEPRTFQPNETIECRYRVWIHRGNPAVADMQRVYDEYRELSK